MQSYLIKVILKKVCHKKELESSPFFYPSYHSSKLKMLNKTIFDYSFQKCCLFSLCVYKTEMITASKQTFRTVHTVNRMSFYEILHCTQSSKGSCYYTLDLSLRDDPFKDDIF